MRDSYWISRTMCDILDEMRKCAQTSNYCYLPGLIEEMQSMANRMEAALNDQKDIESMKNTWHRKKNEIKKLKQEIEQLELRKSELKQELGESDETD